jgi:hypothetical protein
MVLGRISFVLDPRDNLPVSEARREIKSETRFGEKIKTKKKNLN